MKALRRSFLLSAGLALALLLPAAALAARKPSRRAAASPKYRTRFVVYHVEEKTTTTLFTLSGQWHAPNWTPDGKYLVSDMGGALYRIPVSGADEGQPEKIYSGKQLIATNDHALSWNGTQIAITDIALPIPAKMRSPADLRNPLYIMNSDGSDAREIRPGWVHGWSPDGKYVVYTQWDGTNYDIYRIGADGSGLLRLTSSKAQDDGPEYSPDGKWVYFCSNRAGKWDVWRMPADGAGPHGKFAQPITRGGDTQDWFPHVSPNGKWLYTISYPMGHPDHTYIGPGMKIKLLRLDHGVAAKGAALRTVSTFFGGQGSGNTGGWAPDSRKFAWTEYETTAK